jgi:hypothetical protein
MPFSFLKKISNNNEIFALQLKYRIQIPTIEVRALIYENVYEFVTTLYGT